MSSWYEASEGNLMPSFIHLVIQLLFIYYIVHWPYKVPKPWEKQESSTIAVNDMYGNGALTNAV